MTTGAPEAKPLHAVTMWSDDNWIYVELPVTDNIPYICKFAFTEGGLSKALHVLRTARKKALPSRVSSTPIDHPKIKKPTPKTTEQQRANAREVLRRLKMLDK